MAGSSDLLLDRWLRFDDRRREARRSRPSGSPRSREAGIAMAERVLKKRPDDRRTALLLEELRAASG